MQPYKADRTHGKLPIQFREDRGAWRDFDSFLPDDTDLAPLTVQKAIRLAGKKIDLMPKAVQYRLLMEEASDGIVVLDRDGYFRMANAKACEMLGCTREELLQLHVRDTYVPLEKALTQQRLDQIRTGKHLYFNRLLQRKDGTVISVEISATMMSDDRILGIIRGLR